MSQICYIGTSGWHYNHWRGNFYPEKMSANDWLGYYVQNFNTVEINASFYRLPQESTWTKWRNIAPPGFCFAVKASRYITHIKRLKDSRGPLETFIERAKCLQKNLGPVLYQLPPNMQRDNDSLESFLSALSETGKNLQHVFEFRHRSWIEDSVFELLRKYNAGFCIFDMPELTTPLLATADFAYVRFHGHEDLYSSSYPDRELAEWANKIKGLPSSVKTIYAYFNNDAGGFAIENARTFRKYLTGE